MDLSRHDSKHWILIYQPRKLLVNFNAWFGRNDDSQIIQEDISSLQSSYAKISNEIKLKLRVYLSLSAFLLYSSFAALIVKKTSRKLRWGKNQTKWYQIIITNHEIPKNVIIPHIYNQDDLSSTPKNKGLFLMSINVKLAQTKRYLQTI